MRRITLAFLIAAGLALGVALDWSLGIKPAHAQVSGLVAGYAFSEAAGTTTADASGNNNTGTLSGAAWTAAGQLGSALVFNGANSVVNLGNPATLQLTGSMTVSAWIKAAAFPFDDAAIVSKRSGVPEQGFQLDTTVDTGPRTIGFKLTSATGAFMARFGATTLQANQWHYVTGVYDAATQTINVYLNGVLDNGTLAGTVTATQQNSALNMHIGQRPSSPATYAFNGTIDEVRIYNRALTQAEIQSDMVTPISPPPPDTTLPTAPTALNAVAGGSSQINLTWTAATDNVAVTGYRVERCQNAGCSTFVQVATPAGISFNDSGLSANTSYSYRVRATDAAGNLGAYSTVVSATTQGVADTQAPTVPSNLAATAAGSAQINLTWTAATDNVAVTGYRVERCQNAGCSTFVQVATPAGISFNDSGLSANTSYSYRVRATDAAGNLGAYSTVVSATTQGVADTQAPTVPSNLAATAAGSAQINLTWTAATDNVAVTGYRVERCQNAGCSTFVQVATPAGISFNDSGLSANTSYSYRVRATDAAGNLGAYSTVVSATTSSAPSGLVAGYAFSEAAGTTTADASGNNNTGTLSGAAWTAAGQLGSALVFNGANSVVNLGNPATLQLTGSMTVSAWIKAAAFPFDDAAIVSKRSGVPEQGFQLDTTVDTGPRTIGFKLTSATGAFMARFGATTLQANQWHYVTGVYDAATQTINVYLNGVLDNGTLAGTVTATQQNSALNMHIGQRPSSPATYAFNGTIDEVRIYNRALTQAEIQSDMVTPISPPPPDTTLPTAPTALNAVAGGSSQINLTWTAATDNVAVTGYRVERCQNAGCSTFVQVATPAGTSFNDSGLSANTSYSYRVRATDAAGNLGAYSTVVSATTQGVADTQAPTVPSNLAATAAGSAQINLTWTAATDNVAVTGYRVERCQNAGCSTFVQVATPAGISFNDSGLSANTSYSYRVRATDAAGNLGAYSTVVSATTQGVADTQAPTVPSNLAATAAGSAQINLTWTAATDNVAVTGYRVERCQNAGCSTFVQVATPAGISFNDSGLSANTSYSYRVRATDAAGNLGAYSTVVSATTQGVADTQAPTVPSNLAATAAGSAQINLTWTAATDNVAVTGYRVERCQNAGCSTFVQVATPAGTGFNDSGLSANTSYSYRVRATDAAGNLGAYSTVVSATTSSAPSGLVAGYAFSEAAGTTTADASGNNNTGTLSGAAWTAAGQLGSALVFNGANSVVNLGNPATLQLTGSMTVSAWIKAAAFPFDDAAIVSKRSGVPEQGFQLDTTVDTGPRTIGFKLTSATGAFMARFGATTLQANQWHYVTGVYDAATQTINVYLNGVLDNGTLAGTVTATQQNSALNMHIGQRPSSPATYAFNGTIDEVRIYNRALTQAEIQSDMASPIGSVTPLPAASLSSSTITFPGQVTGSTSSTQSATLTNTGTAALLISSITIAGSHSLDYGQTNDCGASLAPGAACTINVVFTPSATGTRTASVVISDNAPGGSQTIALSGTGVASAGFAVSPKVAALTITRTQQFTANGGGVTWLVNGVPGGSSTVGTITPSGLYTPPGTAGVYTVTASASAQTANATVYVTNNPGVFTHHNDNARTGQNLNETILTPANVTATSFGKLFSYALDGIAYASPLYAANVNIPGLGLRNVVYIATEHNSVYAFDADGLSSTPLWQVNFNNPAAGITTIPILDVDPDADIGPEVGNTGTPVIDPATGTLYLVARTKEVSGSTTNYVQKLHALDIKTGAAKFGSPVVIQASVPGTGMGSQGNQMPFNSRQQNQRSALLLNNGVVYIAFGSHSDAQPYHGWVLGYNATTLQQIMAFNATPNGEGGGIWQSGGGLAADAAGNLYFATGDGSFSANTGGKEYGNSFVKLSPSGTVLGYFTPFNYAILDANNFDLGAGGILLLPPQAGAHPNLLVFGGKDANVYLVDRDNPGGFNPNNNTHAVQTLPNRFPNGTPPYPGNYSTPVYFNGSVYFGPVADKVQAYALTNGVLSTAPTSSSSATYDYPGGALAISANGSSNGILWSIQRSGPVLGGQGTAPAILRAHNAANLANELYNSNQAGSRDTIGSFASKFSVPLVVNGKVYVGSEANLTIFGLLP